MYIVKPYWGFKLYIIIIYCIDLELIFPNCVESAENGPAVVTLDGENDDRLVVTITKAYAKECIFKASNLVLMCC